MDNFESKFNDLETSICVDPDDISSKDNFKLRGDDIQNFLAIYGQFENKAEEAVPSDSVQKILMMRIQSGTLTQI